MKINLKDISTLTLVEARKQVKTLTDSQLNAMIKKVNKLLEIVNSESDARYEQMLIDEAEAIADEEIENLPEPTEE
jgi:hypothetical protein